MASFSYSLLLTAAFALAPVAMAESRDPLGETADYKVDRNSSRTSSLIQGGSMEAAVTAAFPDDADGPSHEVTIDWTLRIQVVGNQSGSEVVRIPTDYFTEEFLQDLRVNGTYVGPKFKARHEGYADARNMDGAFYPNCDKVRIYDIEQEERGPAPSSDIEDLEILAHISYGVPVLGAVKMDMTGKYQGQRIKAGTDYETP